MADMDPSSDRPRTHLSVHIVVYALLGVLMLYVLVARYIHPLVLRDEIGVEPAHVAQVEHRLDPNTAEWPELANLPDVGETLAKRIVDYRERRRKITGSPVVFGRIEDLQAVSGLGPKTTEGLAPHLRFPSPTVQHRP
jgi:competence protein ComEA